jgi:hypothetical protein
MSASEQLKRLEPPYDLTRTQSWIEIEGKMKNFGFEETCQACSRARAALGESE